ncbi:MAG: XTP/dITP diphosphatase [Thermodesulfovibrionales bacterium]
MKIVLATRNRKKIVEMERMFRDVDVSFASIDSFPGCPEVVEDGRTFRANARKKAVTIARYTGCPALADDSGLVVDALGGAPGVYSARYAGEGATDHENLLKLLRDLRGVPDGERSARFVCCICFALPDGSFRTFTSSAKGAIGRHARGANGFGYDPVFFPDGHDRTFAEMEAPEKDRLSHRGKAMRKFHDFLKKRANQT